MSKADFYTNLESALEGKGDSLLFTIKNISVIGDFSSLVLGIDKASLEHVTLQSILSDDYGNFLKQLESIASPDNDYILSLKQQLYRHENSPISWIAYENCFCYLEDYISLIKYSGDSPGKYFGNESFNGWLDKLYQEDAEMFSFDTGEVAVGLIYQLFLLLDYLKEKNFNQYFQIQSILITCNGKVKLFPSIDNKNFVNNKDPEDILIDLHKNKVGSSKTLDFLNEDILNETVNKVGYSRNLFVAGLISVRILFKDWSPFLVSDLTQEVIEKFRIDDENEWLVRCVYEDNIYQNFIRNGMINAVSDEKIKELLNFLVLIFRSRSERMYLSKHSKFLNLLLNSKEYLAKQAVLKNTFLFSKFLQCHYESQMCENQHNQSSCESTCGLKTIKQEEDSFAVNRDTFTISGYEGLENWMADSQSFLDASTTARLSNVEERNQTCGQIKKEPVVFAEPWMVNKQHGNQMLAELQNEPEILVEPFIASDYKGIENWMEDSISFLKPFEAGGACPFKTSTPKESLNEEPCDAAPIDVRSEDNDNISLTFDMPMVDADDDDNNDVFPIYKTTDNRKYLKYFSKKSRETKITFKDSSKPIITCYPDGYCDMHYSLGTSSAEVSLNGVPLKYLTEDLDGQSLSNNMLNDSEIRNELLNSMTEAMDSDKPFSVSCDDI